jgi:non-specific serine/threonine protein kinase
LRTGLAFGGDAVSSSRLKALTGAALLEHCGGNDDLAHACGAAGLGLAQDIGDTGAAAVALYVLGKIAADGGQYEQAENQFGEALALFRERDDRIWTGLTLGQLGCAAYGRNDLEPARTLLNEALTLQRSTEHRYGAAVSLLYLGHLAQTGGDLAAAAAHYTESLTLWWEEGFHPGLVEALSGIATIAVAQAQPVRAAKLFGAAAAIREAIGLPAWLPERTLYDHALDRLRGALSESALAAAWAAGRTLTLAQTVAEALDLGGSGTSAPAVSRRPSHGLTQRERDVLRLLVEGHSNKEIGAALSLSHRTVMHHVTGILSKLGVENRTAATHYAVRHGLV